MGKKTMNELIIAVQWGVQQSLVVKHPKTGVNIYNILASEFVQSIAETNVCTTFE